MDLTQIAYGTWSGGRFMHFGEQLDEQRFVDAIRLAYDCGYRTFVTADVYGVGRADEMLGNALSGVDRSTYCLVGTIGHDIYGGLRDGAKGYARFTDPGLRGPEEYASYIRMATEKSLERCRTDHFDLLFLHNPDERGYTSEEVWNGLAAVKTAGLTKRLGIAPGPANGFSYDLIRCFEHFCEHIDWAMLILNPLEPWPGSLVLPAAEEFGVKVVTRVVDYGGLFHGDVKPGHVFRPGDHRTYRPAGWVEHGWEKIAKMQPIADKYGLSLIQFASLWNLAQPAVASVIPTFIQEAGETARAVEDKIRDLAAMPKRPPFTQEELDLIRTIGDNTGCMTLKGASRRHESSDRPDEWAMRPELEELVDKWNLESIR